MQILNINLIPGYYPCSVGHVSANDNNRVFRLNLYDDCVPYVLKGTDSLILKVRKPNGVCSTIPVVNTINSYVDINITSDLTDIPGKLYCKLVINGVGAKSFYINVE